MVLQTRAPRRFSIDRLRVRPIRSYMLFGLALRFTGCRLELTRSIEQRRLHLVQLRDQRLPSFRESGQRMFRSDLRFGQHEAGFSASFFCVVLSLLNDAAGLAPRLVEYPRGFHLRLLDESS